MESDIDKINKLVDQSLPEFKYIERDYNDKRSAIYHPFLTKDGGLIFHDDGPLRKIDSDSQLVWQNQEDAFHHSIEQDHEGNFWVPSRMYPYSLDEKTGEFAVNSKGEFVGVGEYLNSVNAKIELASAVEDIAGKGIVNTIYSQQTSTSHQKVNYLV